MYIDINDLHGRCCVQAMKLEQKRLWCQHIKTLILDNYDAVIPDKAKELVMMLGRSRYEGDVMWCINVTCCLLLYRQGNCTFAASKLCIGNTSFHPTVVMV